MQIFVSLLFSWSRLVLRNVLTSHLRTRCAPNIRLGWWTVRSLTLRLGKASAEWGTCFTVDPQSLARDNRSFSRQSLQWPTTTVLFLCCLTASPSQIVILRFCCAKILGYRAHPIFSTISKRGMFVWILSYVPSAIALSLFILKSSNLDKINNAFYPSLSCGNQTIDCLQC